MDDAAIQTLGLALGFALTLMVYSYLLGDNPLYRVAIHVLVGVGVGYAALVVTYGIIIPQLIVPVQQLFDGTTMETADWLQLVVVILAILLLFKLSRRTAQVGNVTMAFVMGVGAAVAVGGAVLGTLLPQVRATAIPLLPDAVPPIIPEQSGLVNVLAAIVLISGTITSLLYFYFDARPLSDDTVERPRWVRTSALIGQVFLMIAFGSLFAGTVIASLSILTQRMNYLIRAAEEILGFLGLLG